MGYKRFLTQFKCGQFSGTFPLNKLFPKSHDMTECQKLSHNKYKNCNKKLGGNISAQLRNELYIDLNQCPNDRKTEANKIYVDLIYQTMKKPDISSLSSTISDPRNVNKLCQLCGPKESKNYFLNNF
jgi:ribosomal protein S8